MQAPHDNVLVKISDNARRDIFEQPIKDINGKEFFLVTKVQEDKGYDKFFAQGVSIGEVVAVGLNVNSMRVGDTVMLDYVVDVNSTYNVEIGEDYKIVSVLAITKYMKEDLIVPPNQRKPRSTVVHRAGELDEASLVIAVVRDNIITPNSPYILMQYEEEDIEEFYENEGQAIWSRSKTEPVVERKVLFVHEGCDIKEGSTVIIEEEAIFSRSLGENRFDVAMSQDAIAIECETDDVPRI